MLTDCSHKWKWSNAQWVLMVAFFLAKTTSSRWLPRSKNHHSATSPRAKPIIIFHSACSSCFKSLMSYFGVSLPTTTMTTTERNGRRAVPEVIQKRSYRFSVFLGAMPARVSHSGFYSIRTGCVDDGWITAENWKQMGKATPTLCLFGGTQGAAGFNGQLKQKN